MKKNIIFLITVFITMTAISQDNQLPVINVKGSSLQVLNMDAAGRMPWGGYTQVGESVRHADNGTSNTKAIIKAVGSNEGKVYAASVCDSITAHGYSDWYLPAIEELKAIHQNLKAVGLGTSNTYWSSTEASGTQAAAVYMYSGAVYNEAKVNTNHLVCVRRN
jgi:hypothetical protein